MSLIKEFSKTNKSYMDILKFMVDNRDEIYGLVKHVTWEDIMSGHVVLTEEIINKEIKNLILEKAGEYLDGLKVQVKDGVLIVYVTGQFRGIPFRASYIVKIDKFEFYPGRHVITLKYKENISSIMNFSNSFIMRSISNLAYSFIGKTFAEKGLDNQPGITFGENEIVINLDNVPGFAEIREKEIIDTLLSVSNIELSSCKDGKIVFKAGIEFPEKVEEVAV